MLTFEIPSIKRKNDAVDYINEFHKFKSAINGTGGLEINDYEVWLKKVTIAHQGIVSKKGRVPASTYFAIVNEKVVGMINIRHKLNEYLITSGSGHIGYSVRPTERQKGYATKMLEKGLDILKKEFSIKQALVGCYEDNIGSKKTILKNGGLLKEKIDEEGKITLAFTIDL